MTPEPTLAERLGGRWAISRIGYALALAAAAVVLLNLMQGEGGPDLRAVGLALALVVAGTAPLDLVLHRTVFARRAERPVALPWVMAKHAAAGIVLAASAWWVSTIVFDDLVPPAPSVWLTVPLVAVWGGCTVTVTLDLWWRSTQSRVALDDEAARLDLALLHQLAIADEITRTEVSLIGEELHRLHRDLDEITRDFTALPATDHPTLARTLALRLRSVSQGTVRASSSQLWRHAERLLPRATWRSQVLNVLRTQPFRPLVIITMGLMPGMLWETEDLGLLRSGAITAVGIGVLLGVCHLANSTMARWPRWHHAVYIATVVLLQIGQLVAIEVKNSWIPGYVTTTDAVVQVITGVLLIVCSSGWATFWNLAHRREEMFAAQLGPARAQIAARSVTLAHAARSVAHELHSGVQARLFACAMALEDAADQGDMVALTRTLAATREALSHPMAPPPEGHNLDGVAEAAIATWEGLCEITLQRPEHLGEGVDPVVVRRLIDEGLMNAIRHGGARRVEVTLERCASQRLRIEIRDDGTPTAPQSSRGLGSAIFDQIAPGRWGRVSDSSGAPGTLLWVELAPH